MTNRNGFSPALSPRFLDKLVPEADTQGEVSITSMAVLRVFFGMVMVYSLSRFLFAGWVDELWIRPSFFFKYQGASWMPVWEPTGLYLHLGITLSAAVLITLGLFTRSALLVFGLGFLGLQLFDKTNYLNHYYLVICLIVPLILSPCGEAISLDVWRGALPLRVRAPAWNLGLFRFQVGIVYLFAAIAKMGNDWLIHAQPLGIWLSSRGDLPLIGGLLSRPESAFIMSWLGFLYDLLIVVFLYWRRSRSWAYLVVLTFHGITWCLFDIGIFPLLMSVLTPIFFNPDWPQSALKRLTTIRFKDKGRDDSLTLVEEPQSSRHRDLTQLFLGWALAIWCGFHLLFPLRTFLLEDQVLWSERGMRYSWRVMVREKMGSITYRIRPLSGTREWEVNPRKYVQPRQLSEMSGQPDMIWELAHWIAQDMRAHFGEPVAVYVDALVSLNGRPPQRLINPDLNLIEVTLDDPRLIMPPPTTPPLHQVIR